MKDPALQIPRYMGFSGALALGFWLVKASLDAMRVGLLTRFMGVVGIALGPAFVLQFGFLILPVWLIALGAMFAGFWPRGLPPAWQSGESLPWPSSQDVPAASLAEQPDGGRNGEVDPAGPQVRRSGRRARRGRG